MTPHPLQVSSGNASLAQLLQKAQREVTILQHACNDYEVQLMSGHRERSCLEAANQALQQQMNQKAAWLQQAEAALLHGEANSLDADDLNEASPSPLSAPASTALQSPAGVPPADAALPAQGQARGAEIAPEAAAGSTSKQPLSPTVTELLQQRQAQRQEVNHQWAEAGKQQQQEQEQRQLHDRLAPAQPQHPQLPTTSDAGHRQQAEDLRAEHAAQMDCVAAKIAEYKERVRTLEAEAAQAAGGAQRVQQAAEQRVQQLEAEVLAAQSSTQQAHQADQRRASDLEAALSLLKAEHSTARQQLEEVREAQALSARQAAELQLSNGKLEADLADALQRRSDADSASCQQGELHKSQLAALQAKCGALESELQQQKQQAVVQQQALREREARLQDQAQLLQQQLLQAKQLEAVELHGSGGAVNDFRRILQEWHRQPLDVCVEPELDQLQRRIALNDLSLEALLRKCAAE